MKILSVRGENLNSLKGEWRLDLTAEPLASAGLFAITGPTGAGKTTLLDAVTLALYGKVARYGNESNPEHVMTRHCGECSAEVAFEVPSGVYRATWELHCARNKAGGKLQPPQRHIYDADGQALAQQIREADLKIEELLGLNYERFLRSVLLAQGDFARFLKANANERAELLESLTGTVIYSRLGMLAHAEAHRRESKLREKEAGLEQIAMLDDDARKALEAAIAQGEERREQLTEAVQAGAALLAQITDLEGARNRERQAVVTQRGIEEERKTVENDLERLRLHRVAEPFTAELAGLEIAENALKSAIARRVGTETAHAKATQVLGRANRILRASTEAALATCQRKAKEAGAAVDRETAIASEARVWLDQHQHDMRLADEVGDLAAAIGDLKNARHVLSRNWVDWIRAASGLLPGTAISLPESLETTKGAELDEVLAEFMAHAGARQAALKAASKEARTQYELHKDHLEKTKLIARFDDHRAELKSGERCPLCGGLDHPYVDGAVPGDELTVLQNAVEKASEILEESREAHRDFAGTLNALTSGRDALLERLRGRESCYAALERQLQPFSMKPPAYRAEDGLRAEIQERERAYRTHLKDEEAAQVRKTIAERDADMAVKDAASLEGRIGKLPPLLEEREGERFATKDLLPVLDAEEAYVLAVSNEKATGAQAADRKHEEINATEKLGALRQSLEVAVAGTEFQTLDTLREARLPRERAEEFEALDNELTRRATETDALLKQAQHDIGRLLEENVLEGEAAETFKATQGDLKKDRDRLIEEQATRCNQLETDNKHRMLRREKEKELEEDRKALVVWRRLRELIGSHDGSKFRRYAQGMSLDILTRHANRHLATLSDRYQICRDDDQEALNLHIEDLHQAGTKRPMASLSGGESFLASLALALGLSDLAGRNVRIESLFIDEGFGSLDPDTLEVAIAALEGLRQDNKTVGVISHVDLLKERIGTQIAVEKRAGGVSTIRIIPAA